MGKFDFHIHTTASDGGLTPKRIVDKSIESGLKVIAITDHNTFDGYKQAARYKSSRIRIIPGIELLAYDKKRNLKVEILGYNFDTESKDIIKVVDFLNEEATRRHNLKIEQLRNMGLKIKGVLINQEIVKKYSRGNDISSYSFVKIVNDSNYKELAKSEEELDPSKFLKNNLKYSKNFITPSEAIQAIIKAGGIPVIAHICDSAKNYKEEELFELISEYKANGLRGIEVYHWTHKPKDAEMLKNISQKLNMLITGGSDFHAEEWGGKLGEGIDDSNLTITNELCLENK